MIHTITSIILVITDTICAFTVHQSVKLDRNPKIWSRLVSSLRISTWKIRIPISNSETIIYGLKRNQFLKYFAHRICFANFPSLFPLSTFWWFGLCFETRITREKVKVIHWRVSVRIGDLWIAFPSKQYASLKEWWGGRRGRGRKGTEVYHFSNNQHLAV